jgi:Raf kinase inhibitor-like YbhB/YbcL family protein
MSKLNLTSPVFKHEESIPKKFTCQGEDINPELNIENVPEETKSIVLIMDDPDAPVGTWDHWIIWNIEPNTTKITENSIPENSVVGKNGWGRNDYGGPCPPSGTHRYFFKLYCLNKKLDLSRDTKKKDVEKVMKDNIISETVLMGKYKKT